MLIELLNQLTEKLRIIKYTVLLVFLWSVKGLRSRAPLLAAIGWTLKGSLLYVHVAHRTSRAFCKLYGKQENLLPNVLLISRQGLSFNAESALMWTRSWLINPRRSPISVSLYCYSNFQRPVSRILSPCWSHSFSELSFPNDFFDSNEWHLEIYRLFARRVTRLQKVNSLVNRSITRVFGNEKIFFFRRLR